MMYSRFSALRDGQPSRVRVPPNYSGNAFSAQTAAPPGADSGPAQPDFSGLPHLSEPLRGSGEGLPSEPPRFDLYRRPYVPSEPPPAGMSAEAVPDTRCDGHAPTVPQSPDVPEPVCAVGGTARPPLTGLFGAGLLGQEEIVLLGLCLLLLHEGLESDCERGDLTETLLLLGALLLWGT